MRLEKEKQLEIKKPSAFDVETKGSRKSVPELIAGKDKAQRLTYKMLEDGVAYLDEEAAKENTIKVRLKKDNSVIYLDDLPGLSRNDFRNLIKEKLGIKIES